MRYQVIFLALVAGWFNSPMATAQQSPPAVPKDIYYATVFVDSETVVDAKAMWEDVEIFRRILNRSVTGWAERSHTGGYTLTLAVPQDGKPMTGSVGDGTMRFWDPNILKRLVGVPQGGGHSSAEGYYLKGYGVVFTATVPWDSRNPIAEPPKSEPKPLSEWDRVRKELRGEKVEPEPSKAASGSSLANILIRVLADNGRHFSQLGENERVTVAITLRPEAPGGPSTNGDSVWLDLGIEAPGGMVRKVLARDETTGNLYAPVLLDPTVARGPVTNLDQARATRTEADNFVHLGDQRFKQQRMREAAEAYQQGVTAYAKLVEQKQKSDTLTRSLVDDLPALVSARTKLAQLYYLMGKSAEAAKLLEAAAKDYASLAKSASPQSAATSVKKALTGKLIISAPKSLLDQIGTGKVSLEDFKKQISLDFYSWDASGKEPAKPTGGKAPPSAEKK